MAVHAGRDARMRHHATASEPWPFPWPEDRIARYTARRATPPIVLDGRLDEADWSSAERSPRFTDLVRGRAGIHDTRAAVLWDDVNLYVGYWVEEPFVEGTFTERDSLIYKNNDVELFIAGKDAYYEFEINSLGTIYEVFFIWERAYESAGYARLPEFARGKEGVRPFRGVGFKNHPRGPRIGYWNWDLPGLKTAVHVDGTVNDNADRDRGWTVELVIPWTGLAAARPARRPLAAPEGRRRLAHGFLALQPVQGSPAVAGPGRLGVEPARRLGFPHPRGVPPRPLFNRDAGAWCR